MSVKLTNHFYLFENLLLNWNNLAKVEKELVELDKLIEEYNDDQLLILAANDKYKCLNCIEDLRKQIFDQVLTLDRFIDVKLQNKDSTELKHSSDREHDFFNYELDENGIALEITSGVGGQESSLFVNELFELYNSYGLWLGLQFNILHSGKTDIGGLRKAKAEISGDPYLVKNFKYESGIHRIQRVPKTEKSGRIHTSTVAVSILPIYLDIDVEIHNKDLRIDTYKAQGKGGQHVNTTDSAVRITHVPTGLVAECQEGRSQIANRERAFEILKDKMIEHKHANATSHFTNIRKNQRGTLGRSEKIRTYNFPQDRITDHRLPDKAFHGLKKSFQEQTPTLLHDIICSIDDYLKNLKFHQIMSRFS
ncbi:peptide chain release factor 1-like, mitochondrial [Gordionus sp. m RMFG-2023]|uniref:peptide chain release factor 1-like, mitochondrial n=1 Tax=Gordionus sp. m RMFG-2023 TaxID=3053472 RepID=UPI0031FD803E